MRYRRGNISIVHALTAVTLAAFGAVAVDVSTARLARVESRNASEATSMAATRLLDGTAAGVARAREAGEAIGRANLVLGDNVNVAGTSGGVRGQLQLGYYSGSTFIADESDPRRVTSARVLLPNVHSPTFLGNLAFARDHLTVQGRAGSAAGGLAGSDCPLPIAVPDCGIPSAAVCNLNVVFSPDTNDNGAWAMLGSSRPSGATVRDAIDHCSMASTIDDVVTLNNGSITSASQTLASAASNSADIWPSEWGTQPARSSRSGVTRYGHIKKGQIIVFHDAGQCASTKYNGSNLDVVGYLSVGVYDVDTTGAAGDRRVKMHGFCQTVSGRPGGGWYGTRVQPAVSE